MQMSCLAAIAVALSSSLLAQTTTFNPAESYDRTTEFTSRGANGAGPGFVSQAFAYGNSAGLQTLTRSRYVVQSQAPRGRERWNVGTTLLNARGEPDYAGMRTYATNLQLPGPGAFLVTHTQLARTPHLINHRLEQWHHVWQFLPTTAGSGLLSVHMSQSAPFNSTLLCFNNSRHREIPRTDGSPSQQIVERHAWSTVANAPTPAVMNRAWRLETQFAEVVLNGYSDNAIYNAPRCVNPNPGYARIDPDFNDTGAGSPPRNDNYRWTLAAGSAWNGGVAVLFWSTTTFPTGVPTPFGRLYLDVLDPLFALGPQVMGPISSGTASLSLNLGAANNPLRGVVANLPNFSAQAAAISRTQGVRLSTLMSFRPKLVPAGFRAGAATTAAPVSIRKLASQRNILVRNDGAGTLSVQPKRGTRKIGPATIVPERCAVRVDLTAASAATSIEIAANKTTPVRFVYQ